MRLRGLRRLGFQPDPGPVVPVGEGGVGGGEPRRGGRIRSSVRRTAPQVSGAGGSGAAAPPASSALDGYEMPSSFPEPARGERAGEREEFVALCDRLDTEESSSGSQQKESHHKRV